MCKMTSGHHTSHYQHSQLLLSFRFLYLRNDTLQNKQMWNDVLHNYIFQGQVPPVTSSVLQEGSTIDCNNVYD